MWAWESSALHPTRGSPVIVALVDEDTKDVTMWMRTGAGGAWRFEFPRLPVKRHPVYAPKFFDADRQIQVEMPVFTAARRCFVLYLSDGAAPRIEGPYAARPDNPGGVDFSWQGAPDYQRPAPSAVNFQES